MTFARAPRDVAIEPPPRGRRRSDLGEVTTRRDIPRACPDVIGIAPRFARIVLPIPVEQAFTYEIPEALIGRVSVGSRVEVPFGKRTLSGIVVELAEVADVPRTKPIHEIHETFVSAPLLELAGWIASAADAAR
jgi:hypothetical protein